MDGRAYKVFLKENAVQPHQRGIFQNRGFFRLWRLARPMVFDDYSGEKNLIDQHGRNFFNQILVHMKKNKIAIFATSGGHLVEVKALKSAYDKYDHFYVTESMEWTRNRINVFTIPRINLKNFPRASLLLYLLSMPVWVVFILVRERPGLVISSGAELAIPAFWIGKLLGAKTIFVESIHRFEEPSLSGKIVLPVSDYFISQNEEMVAYKPEKIKFLGSIF